MTETSCEFSNAIQKLMNNEKLSTDEIFFIYNNILKNDLKIENDDSCDKNKKVMNVLFGYFKK